jgi:hypothetical protein
VSEFYVGYVPKTPHGIRNRVRLLVTVVFFLGAAGAILFAASQNRFADSSFAFGHPDEFTGRIVPGAFPMLEGRQASGGSGSNSLFLLCAPGKHGADSLVNGFSGRQVQLRGTLIHREQGQMIEVIPDSVTGTELAADSIEFVGVHPVDRTLKGEIVDTKCFLGVMNPGEGKVHRECAALCLSGGIPPALATNDVDGTPRIVLLTDLVGRPLPLSAYLRHVGQPVSIRGQVTESGGVNYIRTDSSGIAVLP